MELSLSLSLSLSQMNSSRSYLSYLPTHLPNILKKFKEIFDLQVLSSIITIFYVIPGLLCIMQ